MPRGDLILIRRDSAADWTSTDPTLKSGEFGYETDTGQLKIGDGSTTWSALPYFQTGDPEEGPVDSVNAKFGVVVLDPDDLDDTATVNKFTTQGDIDKLAGIAAGAEVNLVDSVNGETGTVALDPDDLDDTATVNKFTTAGDISKLAGIAAGAEVNLVDSVNGETGTVVLDPDDLDDTATSNKFTTLAEIEKLANIAEGAEVNVVDSVNGQVGDVDLVASDIDIADAGGFFTDAGPSTEDALQSVGAAVSGTKREVAYAAVFVNQSTTGAFASVLGASFTVALDPTIFYWLEWQGTISHTSGSAIPFISAYQDATQLDTIYRNSGTGADGVAGGKRSVPLGFGLSGTPTFALAFGRVVGTGTATAHASNGYAPIFIRLLAVTP